jgi:arabinofuranosyltransferase
MVASRSTPWPQRLVLAAPVVWVLAAGWRYRWMTEDGFIYLRIVRQIEAGNGPVFNAGERVEAYTGTLWVGLLTLADVLLPFRLEWISVVGGLLLTAAGVAMATAGSVRLWGGAGGDRWLAPVGAILFVALNPVWAYATSGLENGLAFAWIGGCVLVLARWSTRSGPMRWPAAVVLGLGWLVRPELVLLSATFLAAVVVADRRQQSWRQRAGLAAAAMALPVAYQLFRMGYFGSIVPNTGIAKEGSEPALQRGWRYLRDFVDPYLLVIPVVALVAGGHVPLVRDAWRERDRRRFATTVALTGGGAANAAYVVLVGGDYHHARLFLPALLAFVAPVAVVPVARRHAATLVVGAWAAVAAVALRPAQFGDNPIADGFIATRPTNEVTSDDVDDLGFAALRQTLSEEGSAAELGIRRFEALPFTLDPDVPVPIAALRGVGITAYVAGTDVHVLDTFGLADTLTAHLERRHPGARLFPAAGHEKPLPDPWLVARLADPGATITGNPIPEFGVPLIPRTDGAAFVEEVAWARAALACPDIEELLDAARADLTFGQFLDNVAGSFGNARMRIPPDPEEAYRQFCGDGVPPEVAEVRQRAQASAG